MKSRTWMWMTLVVVLCLATSTVYAAAPIRVDCGKGGSISATLAALTKSGNTRGVTIFVTGTCKENIVIGAFDHLTLQALPIATLQDASNGTVPVVQIYNSYDVSLSTFTINGGSSGVQCLQYSYCSVIASTIQQSGGAGVDLGRSEAILLSNNILSNASNGVFARSGSTVLTTSNTISGNGGAGIAVLSGSNLTAISDIVQNNAAAGIHAFRANSVVRVTDLTITGNGAEGVLLEGASTASFEQGNAGNVITGNGTDGVGLHDLCFAAFTGTNNVSGNHSGADVACYPQYSATRGALTVGGTTNCTEPQQSKRQ